MIGEDLNTVWEAICKTHRALNGGKEESVDKAGPVEGILFGNGLVMILYLSWPAKNEIRTWRV